MTPSSPKEPREASTEARKRIRDQYEAFPEDGEDGDENYATSRSEEIENKDGDYQPSPKRIRTGATKSDDSSEEDEDQPMFDDAAYQRANAEVQEEEECPPWHPSMPQPDEDDEEFKPVLDQNGNIVDSIEDPDSLQSQPADSKPPLQKSPSMYELDLEIALAQATEKLARLKLEKWRKMRKGE